MSFDFREPLTVTLINKRLTLTSGYLSKRMSVGAGMVDLLVVRRNLENTRLLRSILLVSISLQWGGMETHLCVPRRVN